MRLRCNLERLRGYLGGASVRAVNLDKGQKFVRFYAQNKGAIAADKDAGGECNSGDNQNDCTLGNGGRLGHVVSRNVIESSRENPAANESEKRITRRYLVHKGARLLLEAIRGFEQKILVVVHGAQNSIPCLAGCQA